MITIIQSDNDLIEVIIKYCNHLTHIQFGREGISNRKWSTRKSSSISLATNWNLQSTSCFQNIDFTFSKTTNIEELTVSTFDSQLSQIKVQ